MERWASTTAMYNAQQVGVLPPAAPRSAYDRTHPPPAPPQQQQPSSYAHTQPQAQLQPHPSYTPYQPQTQQDGGHQQARWMGGGDQAALGVSAPRGDGQLQQQQQQGMKSAQDERAAKLAVLEQRLRECPPFQVPASRLLGADQTPLRRRARKVARWPGAHHSFHGHAPSPALPSDQLRKGARSGSASARLGECGR